MRAIQLWRLFASIHPCSFKCHFVQYYIYYTLFLAITDPLQI